MAHWPDDLSDDPEGPPDDWYEALEPDMEPADPFDGCDEGFWIDGPAPGWPARPVDTRYFMPCPVGHLPASMN